MGTTIRRIDIHENPDVTYFVDVNECQARNHSCIQVCINLAGSYACDCDEGYILNVDKRTCDGKILQATNVININ